MAKTFYFYDLETTGVNPRKSRIMQFAGQRTDEDFNPIGEPHNILIKITDDILPEPDAILITGITPQKTLAEGVTEAEFCKIFDSEIAQPETTFVGFNNIRFDDEFMRFLLYRNFYDAYQWQWKDGASRWDILDVSRIARALRPDGVEWPTQDGKPSNRLELLASANQLDHDHAHDALSDVMATIAVTKLLKEKQPKLIDYMLNIRDKRKVQALVESGEPFVYASGKYPGEYEKTTVVLSLGVHPDRQGVLVYDLRHDPAQYVDLSSEELAEKWRYKKDSPDDRLPIKAMQFNRCPAVAPVSVVDQAASKRLQLDMSTVSKNAKFLKEHPEFLGKLGEALKILNKDREQASLLMNQQEVDAALYQGFISDADKNVSVALRDSSPDEINNLAVTFQDERLKLLAPLYKARNFYSDLSSEELAAWEEYRKIALTSGGDKSQLSRFSQRLESLASDEKLSPEKQYLLEELSLYAQSIVPGDF